MSKYSNSESILQENVKDRLSLELKITDVLKDEGTFLLLDPVKNHRKSDALELSLW